MTASILLRKAKDDISRAHKRFPPTLSVIRTSTTARTDTYTATIRAFEKVGVRISYNNIGIGATEGQIRRALDKLARQESIHGIFLENRSVPVPYIKDVACSSIEAVGNAVCFGKECRIKPPLSWAISEVVIGEGDIAIMCNHRELSILMVSMLPNRKITLYNSPPEEPFQEDILITAMNSIGCVTQEMLHENMVVIDTGASRTQDSRYKAGYRTEGDLSSQVTQPAVTMKELIPLIAARTVMNFANIYSTLE